MKIFKLREKSRGVCQDCQQLVSTTFKLASVSLPEGRGNVDDILCAICDECEHIVSIPQQSVPRVKDSLRAKKYSIEARLPRHLLDILIVASDKFKIGSPELLKDVLIRYYICEAVSDKKIITKIKSFSHSEFAKGSDDRISLKVNESIFKRFEQIIAKTSLTKTQVLKGLILQINEDILQKPLKKKLSELERVLLASG